MWRLLLFIPIIYISISLKPVGNKRAIFGVRVAYQSNGDMITLAAFISDGSYLLNKKTFDQREFSFFASGEWPSIYNPNRINLFEENNVLGGVYLDSVSLQKVPYCFALDSLWKLRYRMYPFKGRSEYGWSQESYSPSIRQKKYLYDRYAVDQIDGKFFMDTSFWKILRDVRDEAWISSYKSL